MGQFTKKDFDFLEAFLLFLTFDCTSRQLSAIAINVLNHLVIEKKLEFDNSKLETHLDKFLSKLSNQDFSKFIPVYDMALIEQIYMQIKFAKELTRNYFFSFFQHICKTVDYYCDLFATNNSNQSDQVYDCNITFKHIISIFYSQKDLLAKQIFLSFFQKDTNNNTTTNTNNNSKLLELPNLFLQVTQSSLKFLERDFLHRELLLDSALLASRMLNCFLEAKMFDEGEKDDICRTFYTLFSAFHPIERSGRSDEKKTNLLSEFKLQFNFDKMAPFAKLFFIKSTIETTRDELLFHPFNLQEETQVLMFDFWIPMAFQYCELTTNRPQRMTALHILLHCVNRVVQILVDISKAEDNNTELEKAIEDFLGGGFLQKTNAIVFANWEDSFDQIVEAVSIFKSLFFSRK